MSEIVESPPKVARGSLKWIREATENPWASLEAPILAATSASSLRWTSPLRSDGFAEQRDAEFLARVEATHLVPELAKFWPRKGPQWDALGLADGDKPLLVEAKAHIPEFCTPATQATTKSRASIRASLDLVAKALGGKPGRDWSETFYQYANRLAHLWFLRQHGLDAFLVLVGFVGDRDMRGPETGEAWNAAYTVADYALGLPSRHALSPYVIHVFPSVPQ